MTDRDEAALKAQCDTIAQAMIDRLQELAGNLPRAQCVAILAGTYAVVAVACGLSKENAIEAVSEALNDILSGEGNDNA